MRVIWLPPVIFAEESKGAAPSNDTLVPSVEAVDVAYSRLLPVLDATTIWKNGMLEVASVAVIVLLADHVFPEVLRTKTPAEVPVIETEGVAARVVSVVNVRVTISPAFASE